MGEVNHEENDIGQDGLYLDSLITHNFLAYVGGLRFVNPIFYSLSNDVLSAYMGEASIQRKALASARRTGLTLCISLNTGTTVEREQDLCIFTYW